MIQTSRTLIESADAVYGKLIQAQQAGGSWRAAPILLWLWLSTQACPGMLGLRAACTGAGCGWVGCRAVWQGASGVGEADEEAGKSH